MKISSKIFLILLPLWIFIAYICIKSTKSISPVWTGPFSKRVKFVNKAIAEYRIPCCISSKYRFPPELIPGRIKFPLEEGTAILFSCPNSAAVFCTWDEWVALYTIEKATGFRQDVALIPIDFLDDSEMWKSLSENWKINTPDKLTNRGANSIDDVIEYLLLNNIPVMATATVMGETDYPSVQWGFARRIFPPDMDSELVRSLLNIATATIFTRITETTQIDWFPISNAVMYNSDSIFLYILGAISNYDTINIAVSESLLDATGRYLYQIRGYDYLLWRVARQKRLGRDASRYEDRLKEALAGLVGYDIFVGLMEDSLEKINLGQPHSTTHGSESE